MREGQLAVGRFGDAFRAILVGSTHACHRYRSDAWNDGDVGLAITLSGATLSGATVGRLTTPGL